MKKYMSVIMTGRNDDYAIGFIDRFQKSLNMWGYLASKHSFNDLELVIVEWNPIDGKKGLKDVLEFPKNIDCRIIIVPNEVHKSIKPTKHDAENAETIPFYEFVGKNVAGRRCDSDFLMFTNPDILFNSEIVEFFSKKELNPKRFYRIDRDTLIHDVDGNLSCEDQLRMCMKDRDPDYIKKNQICRKRYVHTKASGDFSLFPNHVFQKMKGYLEIRVGGAAIDRFGLYCARTICKQKILDPPMHVFHQPHQKRAELYQKKIDAKDAKMAYATCHGTFSRKDVKEWFEKCYDIMEKTGENKNINHSKWGFVDIKLEELIIPRRK